MNRPLQRELFAQRPVRSDFSRRRGGDDNGPGLNPRKVLFLGLLLVAAILIGIGVNALNSGNHDTVEEVPTIQAEMPIKERPDQPGGIDIPHQDVTVFEKLDNKVETAKEESGVEHLLPAPETPTAAPHAPTPQPEEAAIEQASAKPQETAPTPAYEEELPPAVTAAVTPDSTPVKEASVKTEPQTVDAPKAVKTPEPTTVKKEAEKTVVQEKKKVDPVKTTATKPAEVSKTAKATTTETQKADAALARLPKELFTSDAYVPPQAAVSSPAAQTSSTSSSPSGKQVSIQLASMPDEAAAQKDAARYQSKYADVLGGSSLRVVKADLGAKGIYYRIMSAAMSEAKAKAICTDITKVKKGSCIVVK